MRVARRPRIYCPPPLVEGALATLPESSARHISKVLRLAAGDALRIFDGEGREHEAQLAAGGPGTRALVGAPLAPLPESRLRITLIQGISRGERMDWVVQKATELGVVRIVPVQTARSVVRLNPERGQQRHRHWLGVATSACEQCGRSSLPEVVMPQPLADALADETTAGLRLMPDTATSAALSAQTPEDGGMTLLIGPEGGLEDEEKGLATRHGFVPVSLGPRVLRTETAAVVAVSACQLLWGDLSASLQSPD